MLKELRLKLSNVIAIGAAIISLSSLYVSYKAIQSAQELASSTFQVSESVKIDLATLLSTLRSLIYKGFAHIDPQLGGVSIDAEKEAIQRFLNSPSALAISPYASQMNQESEGDEKSNPWSIFFAMLNLLLLTDDPKEAAMIASEISITYFERLSGDDFKSITENLSDLSTGLQHAKNSKDPIILLFDTLARDRIQKREAEGPAEYFLQFATYMFDSIPEACVAKVREASQDQIDAWLKALPHAETLDDVLTCTVPQ